MRSVASWLLAALEGAPQQVLRTHAGAIIHWVEHFDPRRGRHLERAAASYGVAVAPPSKSSSPIPDRYPLDVPLTSLIVP